MRAEPSGVGVPPYKGVPERSQLIPPCEDTERKAHIAARCHINLGLPDGEK